MAMMGKRQIHNAPIEMILKAVVDAIISTVTEEVKKDAEIRLIGFGTFKKAQRAARKGRNPQTGEVIDIAASESLAFKSSVKY